jgi:hypothetical protein
LLRAFFLLQTAVSTAAEAEGYARTASRHQYQSQPAVRSNRIAHPLEPSPNRQRGANASYRRDFFSAIEPTL